MRTILCCCVLCVIGCGSDDPAPTVTVVSAMPGELDPADDAADDLSILVEYADADADLGGGIAAVHDCRADDIVTSLEIPPIASEEAIREGVPISGTLELVVADVGVVAPASAAPAPCADLGVPAPTAGSATFCVILHDSAGNAGSGDCTAAITVLSN
jgi:hypothetical protein